MVRRALMSVLLVLLMGIAALLSYAQANTYTPQPRIYKVDSRKIVLPPGQGIEVKYHINKGSALLYSWTSTAVVPFEFHGVPDQIPASAPKDYYESHEKDDSGKNESHGHFVSPSTGIHGWWWENKTQNEVTVTLLTAGFYNKAIEFSRTGEKELPVQDAK